MLNGYLLILLAVFINFVVFMIFQAVGGRLSGGKIEALGMFLGPKAFSFKLGGVVFNINLIPLGSYVKFTEEFQLLHPLRKILIVLAGLASFLILAIIGLGFEEAFRQVLSGFGQIISGVFSPFAVGSKLVENLAAVFVEKSFITGLGILAAKHLAFNLFPVGTLSGSMIVLYLLELIGFKSEKFGERFQLIGLFLVLIVMLAWICAFIAAVW